MSPPEELQTMAYLEKAVLCLCDFTRPVQGLVLINALIDSLSCSHEQVLCSRAAACTFSLVVRNKVDTLGGAVENIISNCLESLGQLAYEPTLTTALGGTSFLASRCKMHSLSYWHDCWFVNRYLGQAVPIILQEPAPLQPVVSLLLQQMSRLSRSGLPPCLQQ